MPHFTCVDLLLLGCSGSTSVRNGQIVRACTPVEGPYPGQLNGTLDVVPVSAELASSYLGPVPTPSQPLEVTTITTISSATGYSFVVVTPLPSYSTTMIPAYVMSSTTERHE